MRRLPRRWLSQHELVVAGPAQNTQFSAAVGERIAQHGMVYVRGLLSGGACERVAAKLHEHTDAVLGAAQSVPLEVGSRKGFDEVVLRSPGRYDVPVPLSAFDKEDVEAVEAIARAALPGAHLETAFAGLVVSLPGSGAQQWHVDSLHLDRDHGPCNLINVLIAVDGDVDATMGPTELVPGSHVETNHLKENSGFGSELAYQDPRNSPSAVGCGSEAVASPLERGSALAFDDRILHRGRPNLSLRERRIAYFSYRRTDFEPTAYYESFRSLPAFLSGAESMPRVVRDEFPGLAVAAPGIVCDGAGGSQVHASVLDAVRDQMVAGSANVGGLYPSSGRVLDAVLAGRDAFADFFQGDPAEIVFGANASTLNVHVANALFRDWGSAGNIVLTDVDHDSNRGLWANFAERNGLEVRILRDVEPEALATLVDSETRFVAVGMASNGIGTVHDVAALCAVAKSAASQCVFYVDAVHAAPHLRLDVGDIGCDFCVASPYKFFGPHLGVLWGRRELLERLDVDKLQVSDDRLPLDDNCHMSRWEPGTQQFENIAGAASAVDYIASLGLRFGGITAQAPTRAQALDAGYAVIAHHEDKLKKAFLERAAQIPELTVFGQSDPNDDNERAFKRTSTFAVQVDGISPPRLVRRLVDDHKICCTEGTHYCRFWQRRFQVDGAARLSFLHYNTLDEIHQVADALAAVAQGGK